MNYFSITNTKSIQVDFARPKPAEVNWYAAQPPALVFQYQAARPPGYQYAGYQYPGYQYNGYQPAAVQYAHGYYPVEVPVNVPVQPVQRPRGLCYHNGNYYPVSSLSSAVLPTWLRQVKLIVLKLMNVKM
ncbi:hypothetical protein RUND412_002923 [Rhizina undulata]